jgi:hypothetical protein
MSKLSLGAAILLLPSAWTLAQINTPPTAQNPTADKPTQAIQGCLSGVNDALVLTDANGKAYALTGDTAELTGRVGHKVRLWGHASVGGGELITDGGPHASFGVEKVKSLSTTCK